MYDGRGKSKGFGGFQKRPIGGWVGDLEIGIWETEF